MRPGFGSPGYADTVPVEFAGPEGYTIRALTRSGTTVECISPCTLQLNPGDARINVVGYFDQMIQVPNHMTRARFALRRTAWLATGIVLGVTGLAQGSVGVWAWSDWLSEDSSASASLTLGGFAIMGAGIAAMIVGLSSASEIAVEGETASQSAWNRLALGFVPRDGAGIVQAGLRF
jgi:hypothetical protein